MRNIEIIFKEKPYALCCGNLEVIVDGQYFNFGNWRLISGGCIKSNGDYDLYAEKGPWSIEEWPENFPDEYKEDVLKEINSTISWGCCGGCI